MLLKYVLCLVHVTIVSSYAVDSVVCEQYNIPMPSIAVYKPRGLEISLPDEEGFNLVVFYVSVNKDVNGTQADYAEHVANAVNGKWIFSKDAMKLKPRDVINLKIYVQRYRHGYLYRGTPYIVTNKIKKPRPHSPTNISPEDDCNYDSNETPPTTRPTTPTTPTSSEATFIAATTSAPSGNCGNSLNIVLKLLDDSHKELAQLKSDQEILKELASAQPLTLRLTGLLTEIGEPKDIVEYIFFEKLDTILKVKSATRDGTTITFELFNFEDKLDVLRRSRKYLKDDKNFLITV